MQLKCPSCSATFSLDAALSVDAARAALMTALHMPAPLAALLAQYLAMFRSGQRALAFDRVERLLSELLPLLTSETVMRAGLTRPAPIALWQQGLERMVELRNTHKLQLPLKSHGYLLEIVAALAESQGAAAERQTEAQRRSGKARAQGSDQYERMRTISNARGDVELGLITIEQAEQRLRDAGINPEVLHAQGQR